MKFKDLIKLVWKYVKTHKRLVWLCVFLATFASVISAVIPVVYGRLVDEVVSPGVNLKMVGLILLGWLVFVTVANWMGRFVDLKGHFLGSQVYRHFISDIYAHYIQLPIGFHKDKKSGEEVNKIARAGGRLWDIIEQVIFFLLPNFLTALVAMVLMYIIEWRMALILSIILIGYSVTTIWKTKPIVKMQKLLNRVWEKTWGYVYDTVNNIEVVKSHVRERHETKNVGLYLERMTDGEFEFAKKWRDLNGWQDNIQSIGFVVVFGVALYLLFLGQITAGVLVTFVGYVNLVFRPFNQLANNYRMTQRGMVTIGRALKLLEIGRELYETGTTLDMVKGKIEFKNVSFSYGKGHKKILKNINVSVKPGEVVALVGESGAGKTSLLRLVSRYYPLDSGRVLLDGVHLEDLDLGFLREQIAIVPQEVTLFNDTLKRNLAYAKLRIKDEEIVDALKAANAWEFVKDFPSKLKQKVGERGIKLSTGQKQRIAIARAILRDPKILILDEATSALDSVSERLVQEALKRLIAGRTTFIIAHRLSTITHADKILVFGRGKLIEQGKHAELIEKKGEYWRLYREQKF